jgi:membrane-associated phospholipid phosphatase
MFNFLIDSDIAVSRFFQESVQRESAWVPAIRFFSDFEIFLTVAFLIGIWLYGAYRKDVDYKIASLDIFYAIMFAFAVYWALQFGLPIRPRPEAVSNIPPLISHLPDNSFPSGHAIFAGASVVAIGYFLSMPVSTAFAVFGVIMLICRVISGVHYFGDVLVGVIIGAILARIYISYRDRAGFKTAFHTVPLKIASFFKL